MILLNSSLPRLKGIRHEVRHPPHVLVHLRVGRRPQLVPDELHHHLVVQVHHSLGARGGVHAGNALHNVVLEVT